MAHLYKVDGTVTEVKPKSGKFFTVEELQEYVGGYFEFVHHRDAYMWVVDEDGKRNKPRNDKASDVWSGWPDFIVGDALLVTREEVD